MSKAEEAGHKAWEYGLVAADCPYREETNELMIARQDWMRGYYAELMQAALWRRKVA